MKNEKKKLLALKKTTETLEFELCLKSFETIVREIVDEDSRGIHGKRNGIGRSLCDSYVRCTRTVWKLPKPTLSCEARVGVLAALGVLLVRLEPNSSDTRLIEKMFKHIFAENVPGLAVSTGIVIDPLHFSWYNFRALCLRVRKNGKRTWKIKFYVLTT